MNIIQQGISGKKSEQINYKIIELIILDILNNINIDYHKLLLDLLIWFNEETQIKLYKGNTNNGINISSIIDNVIIFINNNKTLFKGDNYNKIDYTKFINDIKNWLLEEPQRIIFKGPQAEPIEYYVPELDNNIISDYTLTYINEIINKLNGFNGFEAKYIISFKFIDADLIIKYSNDTENIFYNYTNISFKGNTGMTGPVGDIGYKGSIGCTGITGKTGNIGITGPTGYSNIIIGETGITDLGLTGLIGYKGSRGDTGIDYSLSLINIDTLYINYLKQYLDYHVYFSTEGNINIYNKTNIDNLRYIYYTTTIIENIEIRNKQDKIMPYNLQTINENNQEITYFYGGDTGNTGIGNLVIAFNSNKYKEDGITIIFYEQNYSINGNNVDIEGIPGNYISLIAESETEIIKSRISIDNKFSYKLQSTNGIIPSPNGIKKDRFYYGNNTSEPRYYFNNLLDYAYIDNYNIYGYTGYKENLNYRYNLDGLTGIIDFYNTITFNALIYGYPSIYDNIYGYQIINSNYIGFQHMYKNHYIKRLNISSLWSPIYDKEQYYENTNNKLDSEWSTKHLGRAIFQDNLAITLGPTKQIQQNELGTKDKINTMKYLYNDKYLLNDLNNFITKIPNTTKYRLGDDIGETIISLGISNILIFNKKLTLNEINYLSTLKQIDIINNFPKNN